MLNTKKWLSQFSLLLCCALFVPSLSAAIWSGWTKVTEIHVQSDESIYARFENMLNPESCANWNWLRVHPNNLAKEKIYAMLLAAHAQDAEVQYYISECNAYPVILHLWTR